MFQIFSRAYYAIKGWYYGTASQEAIIVSCIELDVTTYNFE